MPFLAIVLALLIHKWNGALPRLQRDDWYRDWVQRVRSFGFGPGRGRLLVSLAVPVLGLALLLHWLGHGLLGFAALAINVLALLYAFGRGDLSEHIRKVRADLGRGDLQAAYLDDTSFNQHLRQGRAEDAQSLSGDIVEHISYRHLERHFAVIFWFVVLGAAGALLYRLAAVYRTATDEADDVRVGERCVHWLEWIPVRLLGLALAAAGNFRAGRDALVNLLFGVQTSAELLREYVPAALTPDVTRADAASGDAVADTLDGVRLARIEALFFRALMYWLVAIALVVIFT